MKLKGKHASSHISVLSTSRRPKAIVILLGWVGAEKNDIDKFARIFQAQNCSTICATAGATTVWRNDMVSSSELAIIVCREAARLVRMAEFSAMGGGYIPILIHAFGNGGSFLLKQIENALSDVTKSVVNEQISVTQSLQQKSNKCMGVPSLTSSESSCETSYSHSDDSGTSQQIQSSTSTFQAQKRISQKSRSTKVHRKELERTALNASTPAVPQYNEDEKACRRDMSLILKRMQLGRVIIDATPLEKERRSQWSTKISRLNNRTWMRQRKNENYTDAPENICNNTTNDSMAFFANLKKQSVLTNHIECVYCTNNIMRNDQRRIEEVVEAQSLRGIHMRTWKLNSNGNKKNAKEGTFEFQKIVEALLREESYRMKLLNQDSFGDDSTTRNGQGRERCERLYAKMYANLLDEIGYRKGSEKMCRSPKKSPERMCAKMCRKKCADLSCSGIENGIIVKEPVGERPHEEIEFQKIVEALLSEESHKMKLLNQDSFGDDSTTRNGQGRERCERLYAKMYANLLDEIGYRSGSEKMCRSPKKSPDPKKSPERMCAKTSRRKCADLSCSGIENEIIVKEPVGEKTHEEIRRRSGSRKGSIFQSLRSLVNCTNYPSCNS